MERRAERAPSVLAQDTRWYREQRARLGLHSVAHGQGLGRGSCVEVGGQGFPQVARVSSEPGAAHRLGSRPLPLCTLLWNQGSAICPLQGYVHGRAGGGGTAGHRPVSFPRHCPPAPLLARGSSVVPSQTCCWSAAFPASTEPTSSPSLSSAPRACGLPAAGPSKGQPLPGREQLPAVAASVIPGVHASASRFFRNLVNNRPRRPLWTHGLVSGPARKALANPGSRPHSPRTGSVKGTDAARPPPSPPR